MKVGPVHLIRDDTFRRLHAMQDLWHRFSAELTAARADGNPLADRVLEHTHGLMHSPLAARMPVPRLPDAPPEDDPAADEAAARVVAAYHKALAADAAPPAPSLWDRIRDEKAEFLAALESRDVPAVRRMLDRMFVTNLTWGLGQVHPSHLDLLRRPMTHLHFHFTDTLVSLAEAVGACRMTCMSQDSTGHLRPLNRDLDPLYEATAARLGFDPSFPAVGSAYGFTVAGRLATPDSLYHAYTAHRVRQLGAGPDATVYELGGGYGCLAVTARRAGVGRYAIFDLPWVNVLQGYFLLRALPEGTVRLYGESSGEVAVLPYWELYTAPDKSCDVFVNTDSLPEMGAETAGGYLPHVRRVTRRAFLSINQEAKAAVPGVGEQTCVRELVDAAGGFAVRSRQRHWIRQGYVEEVSEPVG